MENNKIVQPGISLNDLASQISVRNYRVKERRYEKLMADDKRYYGDKFEHVRDLWIKRNTDLENNIQSVLNFKSEFISKVKALQAAENTNNAEQIVSSLNEIIQLIDANRNLKLDDSKSWNDEGVPEYTLEEYLEKYGYKDYFQNLRAQYGGKAEEKPVNQEIEDKQDTKVEEIVKEEVVEQPTPVIENDIKEPEQDIQQPVNNDIETKQKEATISQPGISLNDLASQISVRNYRVKERRYEKLMADDKRYYGDKFEHVRDLWIKRNTDLENNIQSVLNFKSEFISKVKALQAAENTNNAEQIVSSLNEIIQLIDANRNLKLDDSKSWNDEGVPEYTLEEYLEKYGYKDYFQNLRAQYGGKAEEKPVNQEIEDKQDTKVEEIVKEEVVEQPAPVIENNNQEQKDSEIKELQEEKFKLLFAQQLEINNKLQSIGLADEDKQRLMQEVINQMQGQTYQEDYQGKTM